MGVRFACHACGQRLNIKSELAGRRGKCPGCNTRFRIPTEDSDFSTPLPEKNTPPAAQPEPAPSAPHSTSPTLDGTDHPATEHTPPHPATAEQPIAAEQPAAEQHAAEQHAAEQAVATEQPVPEQPIASPPDPAPVADATSQRFALLDEDPGALWYVRPKSGGQYGPASGELLYEWIEQGRVSPSALLWRDGWAQWRGALDVLPELDSSPAQPASPTIAINTDPAARTTANPVVVAPMDNLDGDAKLTGDNQPSVVRSQRKGRRMLMISLLLAACLALVVALIVAVAQSS